MNKIKSLRKSGGDDDSLQYPDNDQETISDLQSSAGTRTVVSADLCSELSWDMGQINMAPITYTHDGCLYKATYPYISKEERLRRSSMASVNSGLSISTCMK